MQFAVRALCAAFTAPCALLCALLLYHEASLFSQSAFVCLMLLFTSMQLKFFNIASVNTQALLHPLLLLLPPPGVFSSHPTYASSPSAHKSLFTEHYSQLQAGRQRQRQRHQEDFRTSCQMGKVCMGVMTLCRLYVRYGIMTSSIHGNS